MVDGLVVDPVELVDFGFSNHGSIEFCISQNFVDCEEFSDFESCCGLEVEDLSADEVALDDSLLSLVVHEQKAVANEQTEASVVATSRHPASETWWLVDSGASTHLMNEETLREVRVVSLNEHAGRDCVTATGASVEIRKNAVAQVQFRFVDGSTVLVELEVLVAPAKFNLLSLGKLLKRGWSVSFQPFDVTACSASSRQFVFQTKWHTEA